MKLYHKAQTVPYIGLQDRRRKITDEQRAAITKIYLEEQNEMRPERPEGRPDGEFKTRPNHGDRKKMDARREATEAKVTALLTPEQKAKYDELVKEHKQRDKDKKKGDRKGKKGHRGGDGEGCGSCGCGDKKAQ